MPAPTHETAQHKAPDIEFREASDSLPTILGALRQNPYTVARITQAWNNLYRNTRSSIAPTHLYLKFTPQSEAHLQMLSQQDDLILYDYPLEYEVVQLGGYYEDPNTPPGQLQPLYAVVPVGSPLPNVPYQIVEQLVLAPYHTHLTKEAFRITNNDWSGEVPPPGLGQGTPPDDPTDNCTPGCPNYPCCLYPDVPCDDVAPCGGRPTNRPLAPCTPEDPNWPNCLTDLNPPPAHNGLITNQCGCPVFADSRRPGGCIKVEDTELSTAGIIATYRGVRRVRVVLKDDWFTQDVVESDDNGCWRLNKRYGGKVWMRIHFESARGRFRGPADNVRVVWQWLFTIEDQVGTKTSPPYNNYSVNYNMYTAQGSQAHRFWGAATANNALHEFYDQAIADGILTPPARLDIYLSRTRQSGFALMLNTSNTINALFSGASGISFLGDFVELSVGITMPLFLSVNVPNVMIGTDFRNSDRVKRLAYHELAHAAHFRQLGSTYWQTLVEAEINASVTTGDPWGNRNSSNAGIISICESWAEHIGNTYAHRIYGIDHSNEIATNTYNIILERTRNATQNHVPIGLHHDLIDDENILDAFVCDRRTVICGTVIDNVRDFTIAQLFSVLTS